MTLSDKTITQTAIQMVILDILEKDPDATQTDLINFMKTDTFETMVKRYSEMIKTL